MEVKVTDANFSEVINSSELVMVDFWAPWCGPCRALAPTVEAMAEKWAGKVVVGKCNIDDNMEIASALGIMSIPTVVFFKNGKPADMSVGLVPQEKLDEKISKLL